MDKKIKYILIFLIPFAIRSIPELRYAYPIGFDTPDYAYIMKYGLEGAHLYTNPFYHLLYYIGKTGIDPLIFFKIYPPLMFALTCLLTALFIERKFKWKDEHLILFSFIFSITPLNLRVSWDLQRQVFATVLLLVSLLISTSKINSKFKLAISAMLIVFIALIHELVFAIAAAILAWQGFKTKNIKTLISLAIIALSLVAYLNIRYGAFSTIKQIFIYNYSPTGVYFYNEIQRIDWWLGVAILSFGFMMPLIIIGFFKDDHFLPWFLASFIPFLSFLISIYSINVPDRFLYLAGIPVAIYATNFFRKISLKKIEAIFIIAIICIQPISMLGIFNEPLSIYAKKWYGTFPDILATSIPQEYIIALEKFREINPNPSYMVVPFYLYFWAKYIFPKTIVITNDSPYVENVMNIKNSVYVIDGEAPSPSYKLIFSYAGLNFYSKA